MVRETVERLLDRLKKLADKDEEVAVGDALDAFGSRSYGPALFIPALIEVSPIGGIPVVPTLLAVVIVIVAAQIALGREHLWLPAFLARRSVTSRRLCRAIEKMRPVARALDHRFHERLSRLTSPAFIRGAAILCIAMALSVPPLELLPFASTIPMAVIIAFGVAIFLHDGLLMLVALLLVLGAIGAGVAYPGGLIQI